MRPELVRRLKRLELTAEIAVAPSPPNIFLYFGDEESATHAKSGQYNWTRLLNETHEEFTTRIVVDLTAAHKGRPFSVFLFDD